MVADGVGGSDGEDFIQGADAARKGYEDVALGKHQVLAVAEIITRNLDVEVWEGSASSLYKRRNHTDGSAAIRLHCLADAIHQTGVAAAENQVAAALSHPHSHLFSQCEEVGVDILIC